MESFLLRSSIAQTHLDTQSPTTASPQHPATTYPFGAMCQTFADCCPKAFLSAPAPLREAASDDASHSCGRITQYLLAIIEPVTVWPRNSWSFTEGRLLSSLSSRC